MKLYADERHQEAIRPLAGVVVSALARVEVPAALWRKQRAGELGSEAAATLARAFAGDFHGEEARAPRFGIVAAAGTVLDKAADIAATHALRAYDAIQLASGLAARGVDPDCRTFACFDEKLRTAAAASGFELVP